MFTETHPCALYKIPVRLAPLGIVGVGFIYFSPHPVSSKRKSRAGRRRFVLTTELRLCLFPAHRLSSSCMLEPRRPSPPPLPAPWLGFVRCRLCALGGITAVTRRRRFPLPSPWFASVSTGKALAGHSGGGRRIGRFPHPSSLLPCRRLASSSSSACRRYRGPLPARLHGHTEAPHVALGSHSSLFPVLSPRPMVFFLAPAPALCPLLAHLHGLAEADLAASGSQFSSPPPLSFQDMRCHRRRRRRQPSTQL